MALTCEEIVYSEEYADYLISEPIIDLELIKKRYEVQCVQPITGTFAVIYAPVEEKKQNLLGFFGYLGYNALPKCYGLLDTSAAESIGIMKLRRQPYLDLLGQGVMIGFIDTGIDYTNKIFQNADGTTRIIGIWDQTDRTGDSPEKMLYGTEYLPEKINQSIKDINNDSNTKPITEDTNGHGTFLAGIAAGNISGEDDFTGIAPMASIGVVKLKEAKKYLRDFYAIDDNPPCYQENDIMTGIEYLYSLAKKVQKPLVICLGIGTNSGDHDGHSALDEYITRVSVFRGSAVVTAGGNEGNQGHHFKGKIGKNQIYEDVEIKVGKNENGFTLELWTEAPNSFSVGFVSPSGEFVGKIAARLGKRETIRFLLEPTVIYLYYDIVESKTGDFLIFMRVESPVEGIWKVRVYDDLGLSGEYNLWLPMREFISRETFFVKSDPDITICNPGNSQHAITMAAYNHINNSLYIDSSRGYTRIGRIKPDITAPGVNVYGPKPGGGFITKTGTSIASAHTAGVAALLFEWGIVEERDLSLSGSGIKKLMIKGAKRSDMAYPNKEWGYGILDAYEIFQSLRRTL